MTRKGAQAVADNLKSLMEYFGHSQMDLSRASRVSQRTISNLLNPDAGHSPTLDKLERIAEAYGLEVWQLHIPGLDVEAVVGSGRKQFASVVYSYLQADSNGRAYLARVGEKESAYRLTDQTDRKAE